MELPILELEYGLFTRLELMTELARLTNLMLNPPAFFTWGDSLDLDTRMMVIRAELRSRRGLKTGVFV